MSRALKELRDELPEDAIVACSSGNSQAQILQEFPFSKPKTLLTTGGFSTMGWALPAAMGAKLAKPDAPVVAAVGDGDFMMTMQELATAAQYKIPVVVFLANNSGWISIKDLQMNAYGRDRAYATDFEKDGKPYSPDFQKVAEAFECHAEKVQHPKKSGRLCGARSTAGDRPSSSDRESPISIPAARPSAGGTSMPTHLETSARIRKAAAESLVIAWTID
jgi:acetolactate synthase-1/2/3 large subunit